MKNQKLTREEILEAEKFKDDRKQSRKKGFKLAKERDRNWAQLQPRLGSARMVVMRWGQDDDLFQLIIKNSGQPDCTIVLGADEFRKWLRWV